MPLHAEASAILASISPGTRRRRPAARSVALLLPLLGLLQGCELPLGLRHNTLHVAVVQLGGIAATSGSDQSAELAGPVLSAFRRLHPEVHLRLQEIPEEALGKQLFQRRLRGLGPDLLLVRAPVAISLHHAGLVDSVPDTPELRETEASLEPSALRRVRQDGRLAGLPVALETTLACYDRRRVSDPPADFKELLSLAASRRPVGLSVEPIGIWWTAGPFGAANVLAPLITDRRMEDPVDPRLARASLENWLQWLRQASQQTGVDIASGPEDLMRGLAAGRLAWIPCYSLSLGWLHHKMGARLGVSVLPSGPGGPPSPFSTERVWAFGTDSSPRQRRLAEELARLSLNPTLQRQITLENQVTLPVNRYVAVPVAESGRLEAMVRAQEQFHRSSRLLGMPFSASRIRIVLPTIEEIIFQAMVGVLTPQQAAQQLLNLNRSR